MEVRIAGVNRRAARQQRVRKSWASVILQRTEPWIGIDLIARAIQITAAIIAAEIVSIGCDRATVVKDVFAQCPGIQDRVGDLKATKLFVINAPARRCRVAGDRAICNAQRSGSADTAPARSS